MEVGEELRALLLRRSYFSSEPPQVPVDLCELGDRSSTPVVSIVVGALHERLELDDGNRTSLLNVFDALITRAGSRR